MQYAKFSNGGYVLHKVQTALNRGTHCSAWFDHMGQIIDAELFTKQGERGIKRHGPLWNELQAFGGPIAHIIYDEVPHGTADWSKRGVSKTSEGV